MASKPAELIIEFTHQELVALSDIVGRIREGVYESIPALMGYSGTATGIATALEKIDSAKMCTGPGQS